MLFLMLFMLLAVNIFDLEFVVNAGTPIRLASWHSTKWQIHSSAANVWWMCPTDYALIGFYRGNDGYLRSMETLQCARPAANAVWDDCATHRMWSEFDTAGEVMCPQNKFAVGLYVSAASGSGTTSDLSDIEEMYCCHFSGFTADNYIEKQDWWAAFDDGANQVVLVDDGEYIVGFFRTEGGGNQANNDYIWRLEEALTRKVSDRCSVTSITTSPPITSASNIDHYEAYVYGNAQATTQTWVTNEITETTSETSTFTSSQTNSYTAGIVATTSVAGSIPLVADVEAELEVSFSATLSEFSGQGHAKTQTFERTIPSQSIICPKHTECGFMWLLYEIAATTVTMDLDLQCDARGAITQTGTYTVSGGSSMSYIGYESPINCGYYTPDYYDRGNGLLPYCWSCTSSTVCAICTSSYVEMDDNECYNGQICIVCGGSIEQSLPGDDLIGLFCLNADMTSSACVSALASEFTAKSVGLHGLDNEINEIAAAHSPSDANIVHVNEYNDNEDNVNEDNAKTVNDNKNDNKNYWNWLSNNMNSYFAWMLDYTVFCLIIGGLLSLTVVRAFVWLSKRCSFRSFCGRNENNKVGRNKYAFVSDTDSSTATTNTNSV